MKIAIVGIGAMGSVYAAKFAEAGHEVVAIDTWERHIETIKRDGLFLSGASGDRYIKGIHATSEFSALKGAELCVLATKAGSVVDAVQAIAPIVAGSNSILISIQNGLGVKETIRDHMNSINVLLGVAEGFGASITRPGHAHHNAMKLIRLGEINGGITKRLERIVEIWRSAGFDVVAYEDIDQLVWEKFICNVTFSAPCAVFNQTVGELMANDRLWKIATMCTMEAYELGLLEGISFSFNDPIAYVTEFGSIMPDARPSLALDHLAKKPSEIDSINGMVSELASRHGQIAPINQSLTEIIRLREKGFGTEFNA